MASLARRPQIAAARSVLVLVSLTILLALVPSTAAGGSDGEAPVQFEWIRQFGTSAFDSASSVAADASGVFVAGTTSGALPGQTHFGSSDTFVRRHSPDGEELWTRQFGTVEIDGLRGAAAHASGVYVAGYTWGDLPGQQHLGGDDAYLRRYDGEGTSQWTRQFGTIFRDRAEAVAAYGSSAYVAGWTNGTLGKASEGNRDAFLRKYADDGQALWTRQFGTAEPDSANAVAAADFGVYVAGGTLGTTAGQTSSSDDETSDAFLRKYNHDGFPIWTRQFGTVFGDSVFAIAVHASGVYVAGVTEGALPGHDTLSPLFDAFVRKYDHDGNVLWTRQFGTMAMDFANALAVSASGVYVAGTVGDGLPGQEHAGSFDAYVRKYGHDGNELWTMQFGTSSVDEINGIAVVESAIYVGGRTGGTLPGQETAGGSDAFVAKLVEPPSLWGDADCDGSVTIGDALKTARYLIGLSVTQTQPCSAIGADVTVDGQPRTWGDVDCDGGVVIGDALKIARWLLGLSVSQEEGCPEIGVEVEVSL